MASVKCLVYGTTFCYINRFSGMNKLKEFGFDSVSVLERI